MWPCPGQPRALRRLQSANARPPATPVAVVVGCQWLASKKQWALLLQVAWSQLEAEHSVLADIYKTQHCCRRATSSLAHCSPVALTCMRVLMALLAPACRPAPAVRSGCAPPPHTPRRAAPLVGLEGAESTSAANAGDPGSAAACCRGCCCAWGASILTVSLGLPRAAGLVPGAGPAAAASCTCPPCACVRGATRDCEW